MIPTADVYIEVRAGHDNWQWVPSIWGACPEILYTRYEIIRALGTYGTWGSRMASGAHIRVTVHGRFSGRLLALQEWAGATPLHDPWTHVPAWENLCFTAQLHIPRYVEHDDYRIIDTGSTDVRTLRLGQVPGDDAGNLGYIPHVRHREDVPHEHALPDLYGEGGDALSA